MKARELKSKKERTKKQREERRKENKQITGDKKGATITIREKRLQILQ